MKVSIEGPSQISLFAYDNNTCIVESFLPQPVTIKVVAPAGTAALTDLQTGERLNGTARRAQLFWGQPKSGPKQVFTVTLPPHSFRVFSFE